MNDPRGNKTVKLDVSIWYNEKTSRIHVAGKNIGGTEKFISTVHSDPDSMRGHPNLFRKLVKCLKEAGAPYPMDKKG